MPTDSEIEQMKEAAKRKYFKPPQPTAKPKFPARVSSLSDDGLMDLYGDFTSWESFATTEVGELDMERTLAENAYKTLKKRKMTELKQNYTGDVKKYDVEGEAEGLPEVMAANEKWMTLEARYKLEKSYLEAYAKNITALSRDLTRRKMHLAHMMRGESLASGDYSEDGRRPTDDMKIFNFDDFD